jgi:hypothetical protein
MIDMLVAENVDILVIGHNKNWKQKANIGKVNHQNFTKIP